MKKGLMILCFVVATLVLISCSHQAMQYIGYRLSPDRTSITGKKVISVEGIDSPVTIEFDRYAIPHISAKDEYSLYFALGYMQGRDRRFQLETLRLLASGRLRELVGENDTGGVVANLEIFSRMLGLAKDAQSILNSSDQADLVVLQAYAAGVNAATEIEPEPLEFRLLDYQPKPWTTVDSAIITALVSFGLNKNWEMEVGRLEMIVHQMRTKGTIERALSIWRPRRNLPPHLIGTRPAQDPFADVPAIAPELVEYLQEFVRANPSSEVNYVPQAAVALASPWDAFAHGGSNSNNWAMSGKWTGTGKGAYSSDPHMPHTLPPLGYLAHLECTDCPDGDFNIIGGSFGGLPAIVFGTNGQVAWGPTSNWGDVSDVYVEKPVPGRPGYYFDGDKELPFEVREEVFLIRTADGEYKKEIKKLRSTTRGVILNDFVKRLPPDFPLLSLARSVAEGKPIGALRNLYLAQNVTEARKALNDFSAMVGHWSLADAGGNIAYCGPMKLPRRHNHLGTVPVPGWTGTYDWDEFVPVEELPWIENPPSGFLGTANNQVVQPESTGYPINFEGNIPYRYARIKQKLANGLDGESVIENITSLQLDVLDLGLFEVLPLFEKALKPLQQDEDPLVAEAAEILCTWDGHSLPDSPAPSIFQSLNAFLLAKTLEDEVSPATHHFIMTYFNVDPLVFDILKDADNPAWDDRATPEVESAESVIASAFRETIAVLAEDYGPDISAWRWEDVAPFYLMHSFGNEEALADYLNRGPLPTQGAGNTVYKSQFKRVEMTSFPIKYGPVLRVMIDLADLPGSCMSLPGGQSGRPSSAHYDDLLPFFLEGGGASMEMDMSVIRKNMVGQLTLSPRN